VLFHYANFLFQLGKEDFHFARVILKADALLTLLEDLLFAEKATTIIVGNNSLDTVVRRSPIFAPHGFEAGR